MTTGALLFYSAFDDPKEWRGHLVAALPDLDFRVHPEVGDPDEVRYALVWKPPHGFFASFRNLDLVINLGAGIDALAGRDDLPDVPIMRLSDPDMVQQMTAYVLAAVLRYARDFDVFERETRAHRWRYIHPRRLKDIRVGVLGLGELGRPAAEALAGLGFGVAGWSRTKKEVPGVTTMAGRDSLEVFLARCDIVVCLLPLTEETRGLMDATAFAAMPKGARFVNASRGAVIDEDALVAALVSGHLAAATLDAFAVEPLPEDHPLWRLDTVLVTPHLASIAGPAGAAGEIAANIRRLAKGEPLLHLADPRRGY